MSDNNLLDDLLNDDGDDKKKVASDSVEHKLTSKQERFIDEYLIDFNGKQAAIRAGYSPETAAAIAYENLKKPYLLDEIERRKALLADKCEITKEEILADLRMIKDAHKNKPNPGHAIKAIEIINKMLGFDAPSQMQEQDITITMVPAPVREHNNIPED